MKNWMNVIIKMNLLTLRLPSNSRNFTIPSRFCVCAFFGDEIVSGDPFVSAFDIFTLLSVSDASGLCKIRFVAACLNSLFNWNSEKFRRLFVVNLKTFNMFQQLYWNWILFLRFLVLLTAVLARTWFYVKLSHSLVFDCVCTDFLSFSAPLFFLFA